MSCMNMAVGKLGKGTTVILGDPVQPWHCSLVAISIFDNLFCFVLSNKELLGKWALIVMSDVPNVITSPYIVYVYIRKFEFLKKLIIIGDILL